MPVPGSSGGSAAAFYQGDVTLYHFPGILGSLGWGWLHPRFLVLEHSIVLVYSSEADWVEHREPLDDIALSADSTVELCQERDELLVKLRGPDHPLLSFTGAVDEVDGLSSEAWGRVLSRQIGKLKRETAPPPAAQTEGGLSSWRLWTAISGSVRGALGGFGGETDADASGAAGRDAASSGAVAVGRRPEGGGVGEGESDDEDEQEEKVEHEEGGDGFGDAYDSANGRRGSIGGRMRRGKGGGTRPNGNGGGGGGGGRFRRWPLRRGVSTRHIPDDDGDENANSSGDNAVSVARGDENSGGGRGSGGGRNRSTALATSGVGDSSTRRGGSSSSSSSSGGGVARALWGRAASAFRMRNSTECTCKWCRDGGSGSHRRHHRPLVKNMGERHKCTWTSAKQRSLATATPTVDRWEYLVGRWVPLQLARAGDVLGVKRFLEKFPAFPDKNNLLRAAVRYKQYSLVEYMLDEQHMDVNVENVAGMPLVWFSVVYMQRGDSGVMLRYLLQKGADIKSRSKVGQTVLFLVVSSRGREAIPTLKYLVEECGLSLTARDNFGSQPLHWAVLYGHLDTVQWISRQTRYGGARADWAGAFQRMEKIRLVRPEHMGAVRSWRMRGLQKSSRSLTPLGVAILHNHEDIAKWLMGYGTEDTECIKCKRNNLFSEENKDLALVAKTWPELLPEVLSGYEQNVKRSKTSWDTDEKLPPTLTGWSERSYDIKLLWGSPEVPTNRSPLNILLSTDHPRLFEVKVVQMVVAMKWSVFGHRYYVWELARYVVLTASFIMGFIIWGEHNNWVGTIDADEDMWAVVGGTLARVLCWVLTLYNLLVEEGRELRASKSIKKYFVGGWNLQSVVAYVLVLALIPVFKPWRRFVQWEGDDEFDYTPAGVVRRVMTAPAALFLFTRFMEHLAVWRSTGIFIAVIRMMLVDTSSWSIIFIVFEVSFALAFYALLQGNPGYTTVWESMVSVFIMSMGETNTPFSDDRDLHIVAVLIMVTFMLLVAVVYLNLLVAMMTSGYTTVVDGATAQAMMNRSAALVKWEGIMSDSTRRKAYRSVSPGKGKRSHITLTGWFGGGATEVFVDDEGATAVEPEQTTIGKRVDPHAEVMKQLAEMREMVERLSRRALPRMPPNDAEESFNSSSDRDSSFRRRQAGMLDAHGKGLSTLRLTQKDHRGSVGSVTAEDLKEWRDKARVVEDEADSRRGVVRAQALIRGYLSRSKSEARFLPDNHGDDSG